MSLELEPCADGFNEFSAALLAEGASDGGLS
jgi:hypothetical protein